MIVYLDVFLIENTILNLIILVSVCILLNIKIKFFKLSITSFIGSICTFIEYYFFVFECIFLKLLVKLMISILIVYFGFISTKDKKIKKNIKIRIKEKIKIWITFIIITIIYGGTSYFVQNLIKFDDYIVYNNEVNLIGVFPVKTVMIGFLIGFIFIYIISKIYNKKLEIKDIVCDIEICIDGKIVKTKALIDTGNLLIDPVSKKNVIVVENKVLNGVLENEYIEFLRDISLGKLIGDVKKDKYKIKIIPFNSLGNPNGILCGINPEWVRIYYEEEIILQNIVIGVYFSSLNSFNEYSTIIGFGCIKEEII